MLEVLKGIAVGIVTGTITALVGYAKSCTAESFSPKKAVQTVIVGAVVGGIAGYHGWTFEQAYEWASSVGIITVVEYIKKAVWRLVLGARKSGGAAKQA